MEKASTGLSAGSGANCCSRLERAGRDGTLDLVFRRERDATMLASRRFTLPLQALEPTRCGDGSLYLLLLNPTGGILGGDSLATTIRLEAGAHAILSTPSAARIYAAGKELSLIDTKIILRQGAILEYLPDHLIPHPGAAVRQSISIAMEPRAGLILYDAFAAGRIGRGERWRFREMALSAAVTRADKPVHLSRLSLVPARDDLDRPGWFEGWNYCATMLVVADDFADWDGLSVTLGAALDSRPGVSGGASRLGAGGCVARFLTRTATDLTRTTATLWKIARQAMFGLPPFDLRKY
jgi:urease accessory protein